MDRLADISQFESIANTAVVNRSHKRYGGTFPSSIDELIIDPVASSSIDGVTGPLFLRDQKNRGYIWKPEERCPRWGRDFDSSRNEIITDNFYRAMGVPVPNTRLYDDGKYKGRLSRFIDGSQTLLDWMVTKSPREQMAMAKEIAKNGHVDALLRNVDLCTQNIVVDKNNIPYRVDNGCALFYLAPHERKRWGISDISQSIVHPSPRSHGYYWLYPVFKGKNRLADVMRKIRDTNWEPGLKAVPTDYQRYLKTRIDAASQAADYVDDLIKKGYDKGTVQKRLWELVGPQEDYRKWATRLFGRGKRNGKIS